MSELSPLSLLASRKNQRMNNKVAKTAALESEFPLLFNAKKQNFDLESRVAPSMKKRMTSGKLLFIYLFTDLLIHSLILANTNDENIVNNQFNSTQTSTSKSKGLKIATDNKAKTPASKTPMVNRISNPTVPTPLTAKKDTKEPVSLKRKKLWKRHCRKAKKAAKQQAIINAEMKIREKYGYDSSVSNAQESVDNVLEIMFETEEVDEPTYKRLSEEIFTIDSIRRLSGSRFSIEKVDADTSILSHESEDEQPITTNVVTFDVLNALRNYIKILDDDTKMSAPNSNEVPSNDPEYEEVEEEEDEEEEIINEVDNEGSSAIGTLFSPPISAQIEELDNALTKGLVTATIPSYVVRDGYVDYEIQITTTLFTNYQVKACRRFSQFTTFYNQLTNIIKYDKSMDVYGVDSVQIPNLPSKQYFTAFGSRWKDQKFLGERQKGLDMWLGDVLKQSSFLSITAKNLIRDFFTTDTFVYYPIPVKVARQCRPLI